MKRVNNFFAFNSFFPARYTKTAKREAILRETRIKNGIIQWIC